MNFVISIGNWSNGTRLERLFESLSRTISINSAVVAVLNTGIENELVNKVCSENNA